MYLTAGPARGRLRFPRCMSEVIAECWEKTSAVDSRLESVFHCILELKAAGLEGSHFMCDFLSSRIAPLHHRPKSSWLYTDYTDAVRIVRGRGSELSDGVLWGAFRLLLGRDMSQPMMFPAEAWPLYHLPGKFAIICVIPKLGY